MALMIILSIIPLCFCGYTSTNTGNSSVNADMHKWQKTYGQMGADSAQAIDLTTDNGYVIAGYTFQYWSGNNDMWVFKIDSFGALVWEKLLGVIGADNPDYAYAVKATPDGGCVAAGESRLYDPLDEVGLTPSYKFNMYIVKLDSAGNTEWEKRYGGADYDRANSITTTTDGGYIVAGSTQSYAKGYIPPPHNKKDAWIIKMDKNGDKQWEVIHGGPEGDGINSIIQTSDGGYAAAGFTASSGAGGDDRWVFKLDSKGTIVWEKTYGGKHADIANSIVRLPTGVMPWPVKRGHSVRVKPTSFV